VFDGGRGLDGLARDIVISAIDVPETDRTITTSSVEELSTGK
jgi:hypothetical protein